MIVSELNNKLTTFVKETNPFKTLLIDGKWGCGKTFSVNQFVTKNFKANHVYLSLFGIKKEEDIAIRLSEYLDSSFIININGEYSIRSSLIEKPYNGLLVVLDDLERKDSSLSLSSVYGIINALRNLGFKVICICNSESIKNKEDFADFKDKTFDTIANVEADANQFHQIIDIDVGFEKALLETTGGNWRIIKRASSLYKDIIQTAKDNGIENLLVLLDLDESAFFRCITLAEFCFFGPNQEPPSFNKNDNYVKFAYEYDVEELGEVVGNNFYLLFAKGNENNTYKEIVRIILKSLIYSDGYKMILEKAKPRVANSLLEQSPFNKDLFLLDDKGHSEYKKAFFDNLKKFDFSDRQQLRIASSIFSNCIDELTQNEIELIVKQIIDTVPIENSTYTIEAISLASNDGSDKFKTIINKLHSRFENKLSLESKEKIENIAFRGDYKELTNYLYENKYSVENKNNILSFLEKHGFFLPDLSNEVSYSSWSYCHEAARFVARTEYEEKYIDILKKQCSKSKSKELRKKCNALVKYNFGIKIDFFDLYPVKS